ncbi:MFS transporter [Candidatus Bathyarchaeota archaeon]|jgi:MFS family permease|nr:MFS transporter [Candidatus Bathyarchaeota archaeon]MBT4320727.1 MFS transporter [Candidatus Bathyarchaeota archaeon]MBT4424288.1 MFS transporter [Candidatus Bathyarchaeota archaeon]MBT5642557.1 MFS transporter [Candidatus Bathyarchaeota archaeon]MBT6604241.1 MFS transporter [Candidatus Bathyarchaeota archaeon]
MDDAERRSILWVLYVTIFLTSTGLGTTTFLLPVYAETLGASYTDLGLIGAVGNVIYTALTLVSGYLLDRFEKVTLYLVFTGTGMVTMALFAFVSTIPQIMILRGLLGLASGTFWVAASTLTAQISPREELTQSLARYNLAWISGFTVGPYVGGLVSSAYGYDLFFYSQAGLIAVSIVLVFTRMRSRIELLNVSSHERATLSELLPLSLAYITLIPFTLVLGIYMAIIPGHMKVVGLSASIIGLLLTITNGTRGLVFLNIQRLVTWGTWKSMLTASLFMGASMFLVRTGNNALTFGVPLIFYGIGSGIMTPVAMDFISKRTPERLLGTAMGVHEAIYGIGMCFGPLIGGAIADSYSAFTLYTILVGVAFLIIPFAYLMTREPKP